MADIEISDSVGRRPPASWISPKASKGGASDIAGRGVHAIAPIECGEVVTVKGGHLTDSATVASLPDSIRNSSFQIADDLYLAALTSAEYEGVMMLVNHSCEPNLGMAGNALLVSMRDIDTGEELTIDYATFLGDATVVIDCHCGSTACRRVVTGNDWARADLQDRYRGWFSWWIQTKINAQGAAGDQL